MGLCASPHAMTELTPSLSAIKTPLLGLLLVVAYSDVGPSYPLNTNGQMVINIIQILKVRIGENTYPPAVIAMLVASIIQACYLVSIILRSGRGWGLNAAGVMGALAFFAAFDFGTLLYIIVRGSDRQRRSSR